VRFVSGQEIFAAAGKSRNTTHIPLFEDRTKNRIVFVMLWKHKTVPWWVFAAKGVHPKLPFMASQDWSECHFLAK
jgi:hypothetical protein